MESKDEVWRQRALFSDGGVAVVNPSPIGGDAVAVTIPEPIVGFQGWRYRFWNREDEIPFPDWRNP